MPLFHFTEERLARTGNTEHKTVAVNQLFAVPDIDVL